MAKLNIEITPNSFHIPPDHKKTRRISRFFGIRVPLWVKIIAFSTLGLFLTGVITAGILFAWYGKDLPSPDKLRELKMSESTKIYDRQGLLLYEIHGEKKRTLIEFKEMPDSIKNATIALEDRDFYQHKGFELKTVLRAVRNNLFGGSVQGGSTITQQFIKNALLTPERTLQRKIQELILSIEIEQVYSKDEILKMYLNEIPYGNNAYGIEAAAQTYFDKHAKDLTLEESALLATLPNAPTYYDPYGTNKDKTLKRKDYVLDLMVEDKYITKEQGEAAKKKEITFSPAREDIKAPHFVMYVRQLLAEEYGEKMLEEGGLKVTTTLDYDLQKIGEEEVKAGADNNLVNYNGSNAALVAIDPKTGQILTMVGSRDYFDTANDGNVNIATALRQPGSSFKPYVYATAFQDKYSPAFPLFDLETDFGMNYKPKNFDERSHGLVTMRKALASSYNIPAVKTGALAGVDKIITNAKNLGVTTLTNADQYGVSLSIGTGEMQLLEHASAFGAFATEGIYHPDSAILKIVDGKGDVLEEYQDSPKKAWDKEVAYEITSILSDNSARSGVFGANSPLYFADRSTAAKTGTSENFRDAWTVGYTPSLVVGVWAGNNDATFMVNEGDGIFAAAPIWHNFLARALEGKPNEDFVKPDGIKECQLDGFNGKKTASGGKVNKDICASWQEPKEDAGIYYKIKIDKVSGKRATDLTPTDAIEERMFAKIQSEKPDDPGWNKPVLAWASSFTDYPPPPAEDAKDDVHIEKNKPTITILTPQEGAALEGDITVTGTATAPLGLKEIALFMDDEKVGTASSLNYSITFTPKSGSTHKLKAVVYDNAYWSSNTSISVSITLVDTPTPTPTIVPTPTLTPTHP